MENLYRGEQYKFFKEIGFKQENEKRPYVCANLLRLLTNLVSSRLYGEDFTVTAADDADGAQAFLLDLCRENSLQRMMLDAALEGSQRGDKAFKLVYDADDKAISVQKLNPANVFPEWKTLNSTKLVAANIDQIITVDDKHQYLWRERHEMREGQSWVVNKLFRVEREGDKNHPLYRFDPVEDEVSLDTLPDTAALAPEAATGIKELLVIFSRGESDYSADLLSLQGEYNQRLTQKGILLDKHLPPILTGPMPSENALNYDGTVEMGKMRYFAHKDGDTPQQITFNEWSASGFVQADVHMDRIKADFASTAGVDASVMFPDQGASAASGEALRRQQMKMQAGVRLRQGREVEILQELFSTATQLAQVQPLEWQAPAGTTFRPLSRYEINVAFGDGLPADRQEQLNEVDKRLANGTMSPAEGIALLDGETTEEAEARAAAIADAARAALPAAPSSVANASFTSIVAGGGGQ